MKILPIVCLALVAVSARAVTPVVIAHRGASGYLPEHTLEAKALAYAMGADFLEQDVVLSKDDVPVVLHDTVIDTVTDVATRFPDRKRDDGRFYALDFTLAELKQLHVTERLNPKTGKAVYPGRFPVGKSSFQIPTLEEELDLIAGLNQSTGRNVGIYPEIKQPAWHRKQGRDISRIVLPILEKHGYRTKDDLCWIQCFEFEEVKRLREELHWQGRLLLLMGGSKKGEDIGAKLDEVRKYADGIGPSLSGVIGADGKVTNLIREAHARRLTVHPYTIRVDELPKAVPSVDELHRLIFSEAGADGVFSDFPDKTAAFVKSR